MANTLFVIDYVEWGGFFDQVPPGTAPDATDRYWVYGGFVSAMVISPRARRRYFASGAHDHTSVLKAVEWRWNLPPLTPRDASARNIARCLTSRGRPTYGPQDRGAALCRRPMPPEHTGGVARAGVDRRA